MESKVIIPSGTIFTITEKDFDERGGVIKIAAQYEVIKHYTHHAHCKRIKNGKYQYSRCFTNHELVQHGLLPMEAINCHATAFLPRTHKR